MIFPYQIVRGIDDRTYKIYEKALPWIKVTIFNPVNLKRSVSALCLADTGADLTFFASEIGVYLGFDIKKGKLINLNGIGGGVQPSYFFNEVGIKLEDPNGKSKPIEFIDFVGFIENEFPLLSPQQTGILGTNGFFKNVNTCFSYPKEIVVTVNANLN